ncbi:hypothetical protein CMK11_13835 [Candidatus Poribacteria bacterium]|nr:hypothetical protein [Candidatus Poribacteria bacterium]
MTSVIDENLGPTLAAGMSGSGMEAVHSAAKFGVGAADEDRLARVGSAGLIVVTRDRLVQCYPAELAVFRQHNVGAFRLARRGRTRRELVQQPVRSWPRTKQLAGATRGRSGSRGRGTARSA